MNNISQKQLTSIGISKGFIPQIVSGRRKLPIRFWRAFSKSSGMSIEDIYNHYFPDAK